MNDQYFPDYLIEKTVGDLKVGESGWVVSWAIFVDEKRMTYLDTKAGVDSEKCGTVDVLISRTRDGFIADVREAESNRWHSEKIHFSRIKNTVPVVKIIANRKNSLINKLLGK